jgi:hypothetical protein
MHPETAKALAAVICRTIDYYSACKVFEAAQTVTDTSSAADLKRACEANIAEALRKLPDTE